MIFRQDHKNTALQIQKQFLREAISLTKGVLLTMISCLSPSFPASFSFWICSSDGRTLLHFDANEGFESGALEI